MQPGHIRLDQYHGEGMIANLGYGALVITLLVAIYGVVAAIYGVRRDAPALRPAARLSGEPLYQKTPDSRWPRPTYRHPVRHPLGGWT